MNLDMFFGYEEWLVVVKDCFDNDVGVNMFCLKIGKIGNVLLFIWMFFVLGFW